MGTTRHGWLLLSSLSLALAAPAGSQETKGLRSTLPADAPELRAVRSATEREGVLKAERARKQREFQRLSQNIELSEEKREALERAVSAIEDDAAALRNEAVRAATVRGRLAAEIEAANDRLAVLGVREADMQASLVERREVLAEVLAALQRMGRNPPPALLVAPDDALSSVRSALLLGAVVPGLRDEAERLVADLSTLERIRSETEAERSLLRTRMIEAAEGEERLALLAQAKREALARTGRDLDAERARAAELATRAGSLEELTAALDQELMEAAAQRTLAEQEADQSARDAMIAAADAVRRAREAAELAAIEAVPDAPDLKDGEQTPELFADADPQREKPAFDFASLEGKLDLPVTGSVVRGYGDRAARGVATNGLVVEARTNALVRAPTDGWVLYVGPFRSYGEIVIMNVGGDYRMVLAGLDSVDVALGQFLLAGEPIGRLGEVRLASAAAMDVASERPTLYIELRKDERRIDPAPWFASGGMLQGADG